MRTQSILLPTILAAFAGHALPFSDPPAVPAAHTGRLTAGQMEELLLNGKVLRRKQTSKGITGVERVTLENAGITHDAAFSYIDEQKARFETMMGTELNFKDSWKFNVAAYKLDKILGINMVPVTVERRKGGRTCAACWWVDGVQFDEGERMKQKAAPPDLTRWNHQMWTVRVFDQLIFNTDRNLGNLLIDKSWNIWMIDHSRAFRTREDLRSAQNLQKCDRALLAKLKTLEFPTLKEELGRYLTDAEIKGLLKRRDRIVEFFAKQGESVLYDTVALR